MLREHMNHEEQEASRVLDLWKAGADEKEGVTRSLVDWALRVTGDSLNLREFTDDGEPIFILERRHA